jgi:hypothetical protein
MVQFATRATRANTTDVIVLTVMNAAQLLRLMNNVIRANLARHIANARADNALLRWFR